MSLLPDQGRPVHLAIRQIGIVAASPLQARRLADALPAALERALARQSVSPGPVLRQQPAERVAAQIAEVIRERIRTRP